MSALRVTLACLFLGMVLPGHGAVLNVNLGSTDPTLMPSMDGYLGAAPDAPTNTQWNEYAIKGIEPTPLLFTNLVYSDNSPATGISLSFPGGSNSWTPPGTIGLPLFQSHFHPLYDETNGFESEKVLEISGLTDGALYDLYLYSAGPAIPTVDFIVFGSEYSLNSGTLNSFVQDDNYVLLESLSPVGGLISITYQDHDIPDNGVFNGFQLRKVPEPTSSMLAGLALMAGVVLRHRPSTNR